METDPLLPDDPAVEDEGELLPGLGDEAEDDEDGWAEENDDVAPGEEDDL